MTIIVPFRPGGGFDMYSRVLSRHMPRHIPGKPTMILQFMPGAGGLKGANYFYNVSPRDGSVMALLSQTTPLFQALKGKQAGRGGAALRHLEDQLYRAADHHGGGGDDLAHGAGHQP